MSQGWAGREGVKTGKGWAHARGPWAWIQGLVMPLPWREPWQEISSPRTLVFPSVKWDHTSPLEGGFVGMHNKM